MASKTSRSSLFGETDIAAKRIVEAQEDQVSDSRRVDLRSSNSRSPTIARVISMGRFGRAVRMVFERVLTEKPMLDELFVRLICFGFRC